MCDASCQLRGGQQLGQIAPRQPRVEPGSGLTAGCRDANLRVMAERTTRPEREREGVPTFGGFVGGVIAGNMLAGGLALTGGPLAMAIFGAGFGGVFAARFVAKMLRTKRRMESLVAVGFESATMAGEVKGRPASVISRADYDWRVELVSKSSLTVYGRALRLASVGEPDIDLLSRVVSLPAGLLEEFLDGCEVLHGRFIIPLNTQEDAAKLKRRLALASALAEAAEATEGQRREGFLQLATGSAEGAIRRAAVAAYNDLPESLRQPEDLERLAASIDPAIRLGALLAIEPLPWRRLLDMANDGAVPSLQRSRAMQRLAERLDGVPAEDRSDLKVTAFRVFKHANGATLLAAMALLDALGLQLRLTDIRHRFFAVSSDDQLALLARVDPYVPEGFEFLRELLGHGRLKRSVKSAVQELVDRRRAEPAVGGLSVSDAGDIGGLSPAADRVGGFAVVADEAVEEEAATAS